MFSPQANEGVASSIIIATLMVVLKPSVAINQIFNQKNVNWMFSPQIMQLIITILVFFVISEGEKMCAFVSLILNESLVRFCSLFFLYFYPRIRPYVKLRRCIIFQQLLLYSGFPLIYRLCFDNSLNVNCFCLMHFNMKVLKLKRGRCSAVYKALLYFVLNIVLALRRTTVDFSNSNQSQSFWSLCMFKVNTDGFKLSRSLDLGVKVSTIIFTVFSNGIDTVRNIILQLPHYTKERVEPARTEN